MNIIKGSKDISASEAFKKNVKVLKEKKVNNSASKDKVSKTQIFEENATVVSVDMALVGNKNLTWNLVAPNVVIDINY